MQSYLLQIWRQVDVTIVFITHDLDEAIYLADRILVLDAHPGRVREIIEVPVPAPAHPEQFLSPDLLAAQRHLEELIHPPRGRRSRRTSCRRLPHDGRRRRRRMSALSRRDACAAGRPGRACCGGTSVLRLTDVEGGACVSALFYNADDPLERYNMPDTLKAQYTAFLTAGRVLYSDMGRVLCSIVADTCGWHDTISGHGRRGATARRATARAAYQAAPQRASTATRATTSSSSSASTGSASATSSPT